MKLIAFCCIMLLIAMASVSAVTLADYPGLFVNDNRVSAVLVLGSHREYPEVRAANHVLNTLASYKRIPRTSRDSPYANHPIQSPVENAIDYELSDIFTTDAIVIGTPCHNSQVAKLLRIPKSKCAQFFRYPQGLLKLIEHPSGAKQVIITGSDPRFVLYAARFLVANRDKARLARKNVHVQRVFVSYRPQGSLGIGVSIGSRMPAVYAGYPHKNIRANRYGAFIYRSTY